jgi:hypothetical protein
VDFFRSHLRQVVTIHQAMLQKLLFEEDGPVGPDLAELLQDAGSKYLKISKQISENSSDHLFLQD